MLTKNDFCDYDTCVALKELGYPLTSKEVRYEDKAVFVPGVLLYSAQKWLREEKKLHITIYSQSQESWQYRITKPHQRLEDGLHGEDFSSYEEALSEGLRTAVKFLKENETIHK